MTIERITSRTGGQKDKKIAQLGALDPRALLALAEIAGAGAEKYDRYNFLKGYDWSLSYDACQRHLNLFWAGDDLDEESGQPHLAHAAWHCLAMLSFYLRDLGDDDRFVQPTDEELPYFPEPPARWLCGMDPAQDEPGKLVQDKAPDWTDVMASVDRGVRERAKWFLDTPPDIFAKNRIASRASDFTRPIGDYIVQMDADVRALAEQVRLSDDGDVRLTVLRDGEDPVRHVVVKPDLTDIPRTQTQDSEQDRWNCFAAGVDRDEEPTQAAHVGEHDKLTYRPLQDYIAQMDTDVAALARLVDE